MPNATNAAFKATKVMSAPLSIQKEKVVPKPTINGKRVF